MGDRPFVSGTIRYPAPRHPPTAPALGLATDSRTGLAIWRMVSEVSRLPTSCLVNRYGEGAKMGLHQDGDEGDLSWPVGLDLLGDEGFSASAAPLGGVLRESLWLQVGDIAVLSGETRGAYYGIDRGFVPASSGLVSGGGRINLRCGSSTVPETIFEALHGTADILRADRSAEKRRASRARSCSIPKELRVSSPATTRRRSDLPAVRRGPTCCVRQEVFAERGDDPPQIILVDLRIAVESGCATEARGAFESRRRHGLGVSEPCPSGRRWRGPKRSLPKQRA